MPKTMVAVRVSINWQWQKQMADNSVVPSSTPGSYEEEEDVMMK
jgi:hypothetical protein